MRAWLRRAGSSPSSTSPGIIASPEANPLSKTVPESEAGPPTKHPQESEAGPSQPEFEPESPESPLFKQSPTHPRGWGQPPSPPHTPLHQLSERQQLSFEVFGELSPRWSPEDTPPQKDAEAQLIARKYPDLTPDSALRTYRLHKQYDPPLYYDWAG